MKVKEFSEKYNLSIDTVRTYISAGFIDGELLKYDSYVIFGDKTNEFIKNRTVEVPEGYIILNKYAKENNISIGNFSNQKINIKTIYHKGKKCRVVEDNQDFRTLIERMKTRDAEIPEGYKKLQDLIIKTGLPKHFFIKNAKIERFSKGRKISIIKYDSTLVEKIEKKTKKKIIDNEKDYYSSLKEMIRGTIFENCHKPTDSIIKPVKTKHSLFLNQKGRVVCI